jgi:acetoin:2,6-dichlorophenolindophenol oxidoreductase subunit beta
MGQKTVAETIREITRQHLEKNGGLLLGQSITAVGWVNGTVPDCKGIIELPMTDVAGAGIAVGCAMVGRRPIFVLRFQDFITLNGSPIFNYAAKVKELHGQSAPVFLRAVGADYLGCVHSGIMHSIPMHFPGIRVYAPMTPVEYRACWNDFMEHDDPMYVSEHKISFLNKDETPDIVEYDAVITLYAIGAPRFAAIEAVNVLKQQGIVCNLVHVSRLKPMKLGRREIAPLQCSGLGLVVDAGFEICGVSRDLAYRLMDATGVPVKALGLQDRTKLLCPPYQNSSPDAAEIIEYVGHILKTIAVKEKV